MSNIASSSNNTLIFTTSQNCLPKNFIEDGMKVSLDEGLNVKVSPGMCDIKGRYHEIEQELFQALEPRSTSLLYAQFAQNALCPKLGYVKAEYPTDMIDDNTVGFWVFNKTGNIPNSAVGKSSIAVANDLVPTGGLTLVDGWVDHAIQGNGSTGNYTSANSTGFPIGASEREVNILYTPSSLTGQLSLIAYGVASGTAGFWINTLGSRLTVTNATTNYNSTYDLDIGKINVISIGYDGANLYVSVNGVKIYTAPATFITTASNLYVLRRSDSAVWFNNGIIHCIELRNKMRTPAQIAQIANKLCLPCSCIAPQASYPTISATDLASAYHEYKFDETSGNIVADSAGTLNGTATGTTIVDSEIGLGKARKFNGIASDGITLGNYGFTNDFTCIICGKVSDLSIARRFLDNRINFLDGMSIGLLDSTGKIYVTNNSSSGLSSTTLISANMPFFIVVSSKSGIVSTYINSYTPEILGTLVTSTATHPLYLGRDSGNSGNWYKGNLDYLAIIPRALSQAEIAQCYNALMNTEKKDIRSILPADAISLGRVRTDSSNVIEINDSDFQYGRREKAVGGNRKKFLGWKYFSGAVNLTWDNPFGTRKIKTYYTWAQDANGTNESDCMELIVDSGYFGLFHKMNTSQRITTQTQPTGVCNFNGVWQTSGYIGCWCEVLEDD